MTQDPVDTLLQKLNGGDERAAEQAFVEYEPYLRKVVRRLLPLSMRRKFDSIDVVNSMYCDVLHAFRRNELKFESVAQLRAFLTRAARNRFIDRIRRHRRAVQTERSIDDSSAGIAMAAPGPRPSEIAEADELWERLLRIAPPQHHALLRLRRAGATSLEIAQTLGMDDGSVRRILRRLAVQVANEPGKAAEVGAS